MLAKTRRIGTPVACQVAGQRADCGHRQSRADRDALTFTAPDATLLPGQAPGPRCFMV